MMVLKITVKTLDSQNYQFEAEQDWTVTQFKEHIQETVNVPATEQRLIFCGRVLQNDRKLTEYDCNDKVIHLVRRPPPSPGDESPTRRMAREAQDNFGTYPNVPSRDSMHLEGSFIITATTVETSMSAARPQATATVFVTSDSGQPSANIPVTIPLAINTQTGFPILPASFPMQNFIPQGANSGTNQQPSQQPHQSQSQPQQEGEHHQQQQQQQPNRNQQGQAPGPLGSDPPTGAATSPPQYAVISGLVPVQFEYLLTYLPTSNDPTGRTNARIQFRPSRRSNFMQAGTQVPLAANQPQPQTGTQADSEPQSRAGANASFIDPSSMEIISTILNSIFRQPNPPGAQHQQTQQQQPTTQPVSEIRMSGVIPTATPNLNSGATTRISVPINSLSHAPFMNMIPELAINAASQILSGMFGAPANPILAQASTATTQASTAQPVPRRSSSGSSQYMDVEIDDGSSSQSGSRYHDAPQDEPTRVAATHRNSDHGLPATSRPRLSETLRDHPSWLPIMEADIAVLQRNLANDRCAYFSDAYLSSIPKKRRRMLTATPECVPILQPSPSQALVNILRRAVTNSCPPRGDTDQVVSVLANDGDIQAAYEEYIRTAVGARLESDDDFCPEKYDHTKKYFK